MRRGERRERRATADARTLASETKFRRRRGGLAGAELAAATTGAADFILPHMQRFARRVELAHLPPTTMRPLGAIDAPPARAPRGSRAAARFVRRASRALPLLALARRGRARARARSSRAPGDDAGGSAGGPGGPGGPGGGRAAAKTRRATATTGTTTPPGAAASRSGPRARGLRARDPRQRAPPPPPRRRRRRPRAT